MLKTFLKLLIERAIVICACREQRIVKMPKLEDMMLGRFGPLTPEQERDLQPYYDRIGAPLKRARRRMERILRKLELADHESKMQTKRTKRGSRR
jgi:hypothetical protein